MKKHKKILIFFCILFFLFLSCGPNMKTVKRYQMMETGIQNPTTINDIKAAIVKYEQRVLDVSSAQSQIGVWYKLLATRYIDQQMYGEALKALQQAILYYPANQNLYYYVGLSAGYMAKAALDFNTKSGTQEREHYLKLAESAYKRAIELEPAYERALYGLAILYVFELERSAEAIPLLQKVLQKDPKHTDAMMVLARAYYANYEFDKAVQMYDQIIKTSTSTQKKADAEANKKYVLDTMYE